MCLITISPKGPEHLDWDTLDYSRKRMNDDGFGVAWFDYKKKTWRVTRSLRSHRLFAAVSGMVPNGAPVIIHQRFRTHGNVSIENVHPFNIGDTDALLFHNGTISGTSAGWKGKKSDTRAYIDDELAPFVDAGGVDVLKSERVHKAISQRIGGGNVFAIAIPGNPEPVIINERRGDWEKGLYYSNSYARPSNYVYAYNGAYSAPRSHYTPSPELAQKHGLRPTQRDTKGRYLPHYKKDDDDKGAEAGGLGDYVSDDGTVVPLDKVFRKAEEITDRVFDSEYEQRIKEEREAAKALSDEEWAQWLAEEEAKEALSSVTEVQTN